MKTLNKNTKQAQHFISAYNRAEYTTVNSFYKNPSYEKIRAEQKIFERMSHNGGYGYRILGGNCMMFTAGYTIENGDKKGLIIETAYNTYFIEF